MKLIPRKSFLFGCCLVLLSLVGQQTEGAETAPLPTVEAIRPVLEELGAAKSQSEGARS